MKKYIFIFTTVFLFVCTLANGQGSSKKQAKHGNVIQGDELPLEPTRTSSSDSIREDNNVYDLVSVERIPEFPGGEVALYSYISQHIIYPDSALKHNIKGRVYVRFIVEKDGGISNVHLHKSKIPGDDMGCNDEAIRVVKTMPKFRPGLQNGRPVKVTNIVAVNFNPVK